MPRPDSSAGLTTMPDPVVADIVRRIVAVEPHARIVLFGSRAGGTASAESDYDLVVVVPQLSATAAPSAHLRRALRGIGVALDLLVLSPEDWADGLATRGSVLHDVVRYGQVVHEG